METAICGRIPLSPNHVFNPKPGDRHPLCKGACTNLSIPVAVSTAVPGKGGGLLERPVREKATPARDSEFDLRKSRKTAPPYRVILHNDNFNKREYVVQVLMKVIPGMTLDNAVNIMQEAHHNGLSVVIVADANDVRGENPIGATNTRALDGVHNPNTPIDMKSRSSRGQDKTRGW